MSGKMNDEEFEKYVNQKWILVCRAPGGRCPINMPTRDAEKQRGVCYNCRYCREIPEQEYAGLGRM